MYYIGRRYDIAKSLHARKLLYEVCVQGAAFKSQPELLEIDVPKPVTSTRE